MYGLFPSIPTFCSEYKFHANKTLVSFKAFEADQRFIMMLYVLMTDVF